MSAIPLFARAGLIAVLTVSACADFEQREASNELDSVEDDVAYGLTSDSVPSHHTDTAGHCGALAGDALRYCRLFEAQDRRMGDRYKDRKSALPWNESRIMRSYLEIYRATNDTFWIDKLIDHIDSAIALQDVVTGDKDYLDRSRYGWSLAVDGRAPYRFVVHSGMLTYPMAKFVELVRGTALNDTPAYRDKADEILEVVERTVAAHHYRWKDVSTSRTSIRADEGFYLWACIDPVKESIKCWNHPHNQQLAMGSTLLVLYGLTRDPQYKDMARRLGRVFWRDLERRGAGYAWHYWWRSSLELCGSCDKYEDMGHASIDIEFMVEIWNQGFNITNSTNPFPVRADMRRFARTFLDTLYASPTSYRDRLDGSANANDDGQPRVAGQWLDLTVFDERVYDRVSATFDHAENDFVHSNDRLVHLGYAKLARFAALLGR